MKLLRTFTMIALMAGSAAYADTAKGSGAGAGSGSAATATPSGKEEVSAADADKFLVFFNKFADVMVANKDDCTKMAGGLNKVIDQNAAMIKMANDAKTSGKKLPKAVEDKMMKRVMSDIAPAMQKCQNDKGVMDAMKRMDGGTKDTKQSGTTAPKSESGKSAPTKK